jgi:hypothetical protein
MLADMDMESSAYDQALNNVEKEKKKLLMMQLDAFKSEI